MAGTWHAAARLGYHRSNEGADKNPVGLYYSVTSAVQEPSTLRP